METYKVRVDKDYLSFCSAHFIIYDKNQCERLHGHNYRVAAELEGILDDDQIVFDFVHLKKILKAICDELDHRMLVPAESKDFGVDISAESVSLRFESKQWLFPRTDCVLLPFENTTAEQLAHWFAHRLADELRKRLPEPPDGLQSTIRELKIEVFEGPGQSAAYAMEL